MAQAQELQFAPALTERCIHELEAGDYFISPFNEDDNEVLIRTDEGATSICTGETFTLSYFEEFLDDEDDELLLELVPAGALTLVIA